MPYTELIARNYEMWVEWIDPTKTYSKQMFKRMPVSALIMMIELKKRKGLK